MNKFLLYLSALVAGALTLLFADDYGERKKNAEEMSHEEKCLQSRRECIGNHKKFIRLLEKTGFHMKMVARKLIL